ITMPEKDGIEAVKEIKEINSDAVIIRCSAMGQQAMVIDAIQAGAKDFIVKPFQADRVIEAVSKALTEKRVNILYKNWNHGILALTFVVVLQLASIFAADKPVSDCLNDDEDCIEDTKDIETDEEDTKNSSNTLLDDTAEPSLGLNIVKMV